MRTTFYILLFLTISLASLMPAQELAKETSLSKRYHTTQPQSKALTPIELEIKEKKKKARQERQEVIKQLAYSAENVVRKVWKSHHQQRKGWTTARARLHQIIRSKKSIIQAISEYVRVLIAQNQSSRHITKAEIPEWIVAGFTFQAISQRFGIGSLPGRNDYRSVRLAFHQKKYPKVSRICQNTVSPKEYYSYLLYGQYCSLLLEVYVADFGRKPIGRWLKLSSKGKSATEILKQLLKGVLTEGETVQDWYLRRAPKLAMKRFGPMSLNVVKKRIKELKFVTVAEMKGAGKVAIRKIPLHTTVGTFRNKQQRREVALTQQAAIVKLIQETPLPLQESMALYSDAYSALIKGDVNKFKKKYRYAERHFAIKTFQYQKMQKFMDEMEVRFTPWQVYLAPYLEVISVTQKLSDDEIKQKKYLNKVEELLR